MFEAHNSHVFPRSIGWLDQTPWAGHLWQMIWVSALVHWRWYQEKTCWILGKRAALESACFCKKDPLLSCFSTVKSLQPLMVSGWDVFDSRCCSFDAFPPPEFVEILCRGWNLPCWGSSVFHGQRVICTTPLAPLMTILSLGWDVSVSSEKHLEDLVWPTVDVRNPATVDMVNILLFTGVFYISGG